MAQPNDAGIAGGQLSAEERARREALRQSLLANAAKYAPKTPAAPRASATSSTAYDPLSSANTGKPAAARTTPRTVGATVAPSPEEIMRQRPAPVPAAPARPLIPTVAPRPSATSSTAYDPLSSANTGRPVYRPPEPPPAPQRREIPTRGYNFTDGSYTGATPQQRAQEVDWAMLAAQATARENALRREREMQPAPFKVQAEQMPVYDTDPHPGWWTPPPDFSQPATAERWTGQPAEQTGLPQEPLFSPPVVQYVEDRYQTRTQPGGDAWVNYSGLAAAERKRAEEAERFAAMGLPTTYMPYSEEELRAMESRADWYNPVFAEASRFFDYAVYGPEKEVAIQPVPGTARTDDQGNPIPNTHVTVGGGFGMMAQTLRRAANIGMAGNTLAATLRTNGNPITARNAEQQIVEMVDAANKEMPAEAEALRDVNVRIAQANLPAGPVQGPPEKSQVEPPPTLYDWYAEAKRNYGIVPVGPMTLDQTIRVAQRDPNYFSAVTIDGVNQAITDLNKQVEQDARAARYLANVRPMTYGEWQTEAPTFYDALEQLGVVNGRGVPYPEMATLIASSGAEAQTRVLENFEMKAKLPEIRELRNRMLWSGTESGMALAMSLNSLILRLEATPYSDLVDLETNFPIELLENFLLDPLNLLDLPFGKIASFHLAGKVADATTALRTADNADDLATLSRLFRDAYKPWLEGGRVGDLVFPADAPADLIRLLPTANELRGPGSWLGRQLARTPETQVHLSANNLWMAMSNVLYGVDNVDDAIRILRTATEAPQEMIKGLAGLTSPTFRAVAGEDGLVRWGPGVLTNKTFLRETPIFQAGTARVIERMEKAQQAAMEAAKKAGTFYDGTKQRVNPLELLVNLNIEWERAARQFYGIAPIDPPANATKVAMRDLANGTAQVEWLDDAGTVLRQLPPLPTAQARTQLNTLQAAMTEAKENPLYKAARVSAEVQRHIMSDMWLNLRPAHWVRNATAFTLALNVDGLYSFKSVPEMFGELGKKAIGGQMTHRLAEGSSGAGTLGELTVQHWTRKGWPKYNPLAWMAEHGAKVWTGYGQILGAVPYGEQAGYLTGYNSAFNRLFGGDWTTLTKRELTPLFASWGVDQNLARAMVDKIVEVGRTGSKADVAQAARQMIRGNGQPFSVRGLGVADGVIPVDNNVRIVDAVNSLGRSVNGTAPRSAEQVQQEIRRVTELIRAEFDQMRHRPGAVLAEAMPQPSTVAPLATEATDTMARLVDDALSDAQNAGVTDPHMLAVIEEEAQEYARRLVEGETLGWESVLDEMANAPDNPAGMVAAFDLLSQVYELKRMARQEVDELMAPVRAARTRDELNAAWAAKFAGTSEIYTKLADDLQAVFAASTDTLRRIAAGEEVPQQRDWWDVITRYLDFDARANLQDRGVEFGDMMQEDPAIVQKVIDANRAYVDSSYIQLYDVFRRYPSLDALDVLRMAQQQIDVEGARAAAFLRTQRERIKHFDQAVGAVVGDLTKEEYYVIRNDTWRGVFDNQVIFNQAAARAIAAHALAMGSPTQLTWTDDFFGGTFQLIGPAVADPINNAIALTVDDIFESGAFDAATGKIADGYLAPKPLARQGKNANRWAITPVETETQMQALAVVGVTEKRGNDWYLLIRDPDAAAQAVAERGKFAWLARNVETGEIAVFGSPNPQAPIPGGQGSNARVPGAVMQDFDALVRGDDFPPAPDAGAAPTPPPPDAGPTPPAAPEAPTGPGSLPPDGSGGGYPAQPFTDTGRPGRSANVPTVPQEVLDAKAVQSDPAAFEQAVDEEIGKVTPLEPRPEDDVIPEGMGQQEWFDAQASVDARMQAAEAEADIAQPLVIDFDALDAMPGGEWRRGPLPAGGSGAGYPAQPFTDTGRPGQMRPAPQPVTLPPVTAGTLNQLAAGAGIATSKADGTPTHRHLINAINKDAKNNGAGWSIPQGVRFNDWVRDNPQQAQQAAEWLAVRVENAAKLQPAAPKAPKPKKGKAAAQPAAAPTMRPPATPTITNHRPGYESFWVADDAGGYREVSGKRMVIPGYEQFEFFGHQYDDERLSGIYRVQQVVEARTGWPIYTAEGRFTRDEIYAGAALSLRDTGIADQIAETIEIGQKYGALSPKYPQQAAQGTPPWVRLQQLAEQHGAFTGEVDVSPAASQGLTQFVQQNDEQVGVLLGQRTRAGIQVDRIVAIPAARASNRDVAFTWKAIDDALTQADAQGMEIVGTVHTHPTSGLGLMSPSDREGFSRMPMLAHGIYTPQDGKLHIYRGGNLSEAKVIAPARPALPVQNLDELTPVESVTSPWPLPPAIQQRMGSEGNAYMEARRNLPPGGSGAGYPAQPATDTGRPGRPYTPPADAAPEAPAPPPLAPSATVAPENIVTPAEMAQQAAPAPSPVPPAQRVNFLSGQPLERREKAQTILDAKPTRNAPQTRREMTEAAFAQGVRAEQRQDGLWYIGDRNVTTTEAEYLNYLHDSAGAYTPGVAPAPVEMAQPAPAEAPAGQEMAAAPTDDARRAALQAELAQLEARRDDAYNSFRTSQRPQPMDDATGRRILEIRRELGMEPPPPWKLTKQRAAASYNMNDTAHRLQVERALQRGDPVPAEVLAEYPDLAPSPAAAEAPAARAVPLPAMEDEAPVLAGMEPPPAPGPNTMTIMAPAIDAPVRQVELGELAGLPLGTGEAITPPPATAASRPASKAAFLDAYNGIDDQLEELDRQRYIYGEISHLDYLRRMDEIEQQRIDLLLSIGAETTDDPVQAAARAFPDWEKLLDRIGESYRQLFREKMDGSEWSPSALLEEAFEANGAISWQEGWTGVQNARGTKYITNGYRYDLIDALLDFRREGDEYSADKVASLLERAVLDEVLTPESVKAFWPALSKEMDDIAARRAEVIAQEAAEEAAYAAAVTAPTPPAGTRQAWEMMPDEFDMSSGVVKFWDIDRTVTPEITAYRLISKTDVLTWLQRALDDSFYGTPARKKAANAALDSIGAQRKMRGGTWKGGELVNPHKFVVQRALKQGKPVPPNVLARYPDLAATPPTPRSAQPNANFTGDFPGAADRAKALWPGLQGDIWNVSERDFLGNASRRQLLTDQLLEFQKQAEDLVDSLTAQQTAAETARNTKQASSLGKKLQAALTERDRVRRMLPDDLVQRPDYQQLKAAQDDILRRMWAEAVIDANQRGVATQGIPPQWVDRAAEIVGYSPGVSKATPAPAPTAAPTAAAQPPVAPVAQAAAPTAGERLPTYVDETGRTVVVMPTVTPEEKAATFVNNLREKYKVEVDNAQVLEWQQSLAAADTQLEALRNKRGSLFDAKVKARNQQETDAINQQIDAINQEAQPLQTAIDQAKEEIANIFTVAYYNQLNARRWATPPRERVLAELEYAAEMRNTKSDRSLAKFDIPAAIKRIKDNPDLPVVELTVPVPGNVATDVLNKAEQDAIRAQLKEAETLLRTNQASAVAIHYGRWHMTVIDPVQAQELAKGLGTRLSVSIPEYSGVTGARTGGFASITANASERPGAFEPEIEIWENAIPMQGRHMAPHTTILENVANKYKMGKVDADKAFTGTVDGQPWYTDGYAAFSYKPKEWAGGTPKPTTTPDATEKIVKDATTNTIPIEPLGLVGNGNKSAGGFPGIIFGTDDGKIKGINARYYAGVMQAANGKPVTWVTTNRPHRPIVALVDGKPFAVIMPYSIDQSELPKIARYFYPNNADGALTLYGGFGAIDPRPAMQEIYQTMIRYWRKPRQPVMGDVALHQVTSLNDAEDRILAALPALAQPRRNNFTAAQANALIDAVDKRLLPAFDDAVSRASYGAQKVADTAMLNYRDRRGIDSTLALMLPYHYFYTRGGATWLRRIARKPSVAAMYYDIQKAIETENKQAHVPARLKGTIPIWNYPGGQIRMANPLNTMMPFYMYMPDPFQNEEGDTDVERMWTALKNFAPGVMPVYDVAMAAVLDQIDPLPDGESRVARYTNLRNYIPLAGTAADAAMAQSGIVTPTNLGGDPFDTYRIKRTAGVMAQQGAFSDEMARYVIQLSVNLEGGGDPWANIPADQTAAVRAAYIATVNQTGRDKLLMGSGAGYLLGANLYNFPYAERELQSAQDLWRYSGFGEQNPAGSAAQRSMVMEQNPALGAYMARSTTPGSPYQPGQQAQANALYNRLDPLYAQQQAIEDQMIAQSGYGVSGEALRAATAPIQGEIDAARAQYPNLPAPTGRPRSGSNPAELAEWMLRQAVPQGGPVYPGKDAPKAELQAYYDARDAWGKEKLATFQRNLTTVMAGNDPAQDEINFELYRLTAGKDTATLLREYGSGYYDSPTRREYDARNAERQAATSAKFDAAESLILQEFGQAGLDVYKGYAATEQAGREAYKKAHPELKALNLAAYNPEQYRQAVELFGKDAILAWAKMPPSDGSEAASAARAAYNDANPGAYLMNAWMNGRPTPFGETIGPWAALPSQWGMEYQYNFGKDFNEAATRFGADIWQIVAGYKRGWSSKEKAAYFDKYPQLGDFFDWWNELLPDDGKGSGGRSSSSSGRSSSRGYSSYKRYYRRSGYRRRSYGGYSRSYGGGGWGGGGGWNDEEKAPWIDDVDPRWFDRSLWNTQSELRRWEPPRPTDSGVERWRPARYGYGGQ